MRMIRQDTVKRSGRLYRHLRDYADLREAARGIIRVTKEYFEDPPPSQRLNGEYEETPLATVEQEGPAWLWVNAIGVDLQIRCFPKTPAGESERPARGRFVWRFVHRDELTEELSLGKRALHLYFDGRGRLWETESEENNPVGTIQPGTSGPGSRGEITKLLSRALRKLPDIDLPERHTRFPEHSD